MFVQVIAATNRPDTLDPALLRSGRLDRKIELPLPTEDARARIMQIHSRKMNIDKEGAFWSAVLQLLLLLPSAREMVFLHCMEHKHARSLGELQA